MAGTAENDDRCRRELPKPGCIQPDAEKYWDEYTLAYDFEDVEAFELATLCNMKAYAEKCASMCFDKYGEPMPRVSSRMVTGDPEDKGSVSNPYVDDLSKANREIERLKAALGISVAAKAPVRPSVESPVDKANRKKAEKDGLR